MSAFYTGGKDDNLGKRSIHALAECQLFIAAGESGQPCTTTADGRRLAGAHHQLVFKASLTLVILRVDDEAKSSITAIVDTRSLSGIDSNCVWHAWNAGHTALLRQW